MTSFSVLIIANGQDDLLLKCLESLKVGETQWQLVLVSNGVALSQAVLDKADSLTSEVDIVSLSTPESMASARNQAISLAKYEWVLFLDEAAYPYPKYFDIALPLLAQERISVLGGSDAPAKGMGALATAWALTLASPFCTGTSYGRHHSKGRKLIPASEENLSLSHLWVRRNLLNENNFFEGYGGKDLMIKLLNLKAQGAHFFYHQSLIVGLHREETLKGLSKNAYESGFLRSEAMKDKTHKISGVYWLPSIFVLLHLLILTRSVFFWDMVRIYAAVILMMSLNLATRKKRTGLFLHMSFLHWFIVFIYGIGFLANRLAARKK